MPPKILVITGPTATGKSALAVALAKKAGGEIVSADSMQLYKYMDIGTAKPTAEEMAGVPHHMLDVVSPFDNYSVARYVEDAAACVDDILARGKLPVIVGGTGLYIDALIAGRTYSAQADSGLRDALSARYDALGGDALLGELAAVDPISAGRLHPNDKKRVVRALEIYRTTGGTIAEHDAETKKIPPRYEALKLALAFGRREDLYGRIDRRVDAMLDRGLLDEVRGLLRMGLTAQHTSMQAIGYKELTGVLLGGGDKESAVEKIKMESRRYAKRQLSWLRRDSEIRWILWEKEPDFERGLQISTEYLENFVYNRAV